MIVTALTLLGGLMLLSIPVAAALGLLGSRCRRSRLPAAASRHRADGVERGQRFGPARRADVHPAREVLLRSGMAERMYGAMVPWLSWLPGGLMHRTSAPARCSRDLRFLGRDRGDDRHGRARSGRALRLQRAAVLARSRRAARSAS